MDKWLEVTVVKIEESVQAENQLLALYLLKEAMDSFVNHLIIQYGPDITDQWKLMEEMNIALEKGQ